MLLDLPQELLIVACGAFLVGWILSAVSTRMGGRLRASKRDPRDDRIRELEAEVRIAKSNATDSRSDLEKLEDELKETAVGIERRDFVISEQQAKIDQVANDLKESVIKTRELRAELAERATETVHAEAKIRQVETELSVAQASSDLMATGVLDYSTAQDAVNSDNPAETEEESAVNVSPSPT